MNAARQFIEAALEIWTGDQFAATAENGMLSEPDRNGLESLCEKTGENVDLAEAEVMTFIIRRCNSRKAS